MKRSVELPPKLRDAVSRETLGKSVAWIGQPDPATVFRSLLATWYFAVPWTAFALFWMGGALGFWSKVSKANADNIWFPLFGLPFVLFGFAMLSAPFWARHKAKSTAYAIAGDSLLTITPGRRGAVDVKTVPLTQIVSIDRHEKADGSGTLKLHVGWSKDSDGDNVKAELSLAGIADVRRVETLLRRPDRTSARS